MKEEHIKKKKTQNYCPNIFRLKMMMWWFHTWVCFWLIFSKFPHIK